MEQYGFEIHDALVVDVAPDQKVRESMNQINANKRLRIAAVEKGEVREGGEEERGGGEEERGTRRRRGGHLGEGSVCTVILCVGGEGESGERS